MNILGARVEVALASDSTVSAAKRWKKNVNTVYFGRLSLAETMRKCGLAPSAPARGDRLSKASLPTLPDTDS